MPNTIKAFDFGINANGVRVTVPRGWLFAGCCTDEEIDTNIQLL